MTLTLPLDKMTPEEKLQVMEDLWDDLCRHSGSVASPDWHAEVLEERANMVQEKQATFLDLSDLKDQIKKDL